MKKVLIIASIVIASFTGLIVGLDQAFPYSPPPKTEVVTAAQLLEHYGYDTKQGNQLVGARLFMSSSSHVSGLLIMGNGVISSSDKSQVVLMLSYKLRNGTIETSTIPLSQIKKMIRPGTPRIKWLVPANKRAYAHAVGTSIFKPYDDGHGQSADDHGYHKMTPEQLLGAFGRGAELQINPKTYNKLFGGIS